MTQYHSALQHAGMVLNQISLKIAVAHNVNLYQNALQALDLIISHATASQLKCVLKIYVGMGLNVIHLIIAVAHNVLIYQDAL